LRIEVDQSGKIEDTRVDTVLALSNSIKYAVRIPAGVKRKALHYLRARGKRGRRLYLSLFATALYHLLREHLDTFSLIVIDVEYKGHERDIKLMLLNMIRKVYWEYPADRIVFSPVGKKSSAHRWALAVYRGTAQPDRILSLAELVDPIGRGK